MEMKEGKTENERNQACIKREHKKERKPNKKNKMINRAVGLWRVKFPLFDHY